MHSYYLETCYIRVPSKVTKRLKTEYVTKLENIREVPEIDKMIAYYQVFLAKQNKIERQKFFRYSVI